MSNSDDPLDVLYRHTQGAADDSLSPPDIDAKVRAAAKAATGLHADKDRSKNPDQSARQVSSDARRRYGWATAATVLLTCAVFLSLPDPAPPSGLTTSSTRVQPVEQTDGAQAQWIESEVTAPPDAHLSNELSSNALDRAKTSAQELEAAERPATGQTKQSREGKAREATSLAIPPPPSPAKPKSAEPVPSQLAPAAPAVADADVEESGWMQSIEEVTVTGFRESSMQECTRYKNLLISRVCKEPAADAKTRGEPDTAEVERGYALHASRQSPCAGKIYLMTTVSGAPEPQPGSDKRRFVLQSDPDGEPATELVCKFGRLKFQALARGR